MNESLNPKTVLAPSSFIRRPLQRLTLAVGGLKSHVKKLASLSDADFKASFLHYFQNPNEVSHSIFKTRLAIMSFLGKIGPHVPRYPNTDPDQPLTLSETDIQKSLSNFYSLLEECRKNIETLVDQFGDHLGGAMGEQKKESPRVLGRLEYLVPLLEKFEYTIQNLSLSTSDHVLEFDSGKWSPRDVERNLEYLDKNWHSIDLFARASLLAALSRRLKRWLKLDDEVLSYLESSLNKKREQFDLYFHLMSLPPTFQQRTRAPYLSESALELLVEFSLKNELPRAEHFLDLLHDASQDPEALSQEKLRPEIITKAYRSLFEKTPEEKRQLKESIAASLSPKETYILNSESPCARYYSREVGDKKLHWVPFDSPEFPYRLISPINPDPTIVVFKDNKSRFYLLPYHAVKCWEPSVQPEDEED